MSAETSAQRQATFHDYAQENIISGFQGAPRKGGYVVVAIDIGTTFSGYAMSFSGEKFRIVAMQTSSSYRLEGSASATKIPTALLLTPERNFHSFGREAMDHYNRELDEGEQKTWYYFERFKMKLHTERKLSRQTSVLAANGGTMSIRSVFAFALRYFKDLAIGECRDKSKTDIPSSDFEWVITVPAIWEGGAKQTMREAAYEAGLASETTPDKLQIALEPESASLYCKSINRIENSFSDEGLVAQAFTPGTTYVLADLGGGTADVTVHQVTGNGGVKELHHATGGAWGGMYVDKKFVELLENIFGADTIDEYKTEFPGEWVELVSMKFEMNKRTAGPNKTSYVELPHSFLPFVEKRGSSVKDHVSAMGNVNLKFARGALAIKYPEVRKLFEPVFDNIATHLETVIRQVPQIEYMILVGGFATCKLLQTYLRDRLETSFNLRIIIPSESSLAVVMGAVLFGHDPTEIQSRRLRLSYGIECVGIPDDADASDSSTGTFSPIVMSVLGFSNRGLKFKTFVSKNQEVAIDTEVTHPFYPVRDDQSLASIVVYESDKEKTLYTSEDGVTKVASFELPMPNTHLGRNREIRVSMKFGQTEFKLHSLDMSSKKEVKGPVKLDFLSVADDDPDE